MFETTLMCVYYNPKRVKDIKILRRMKDLICITMCVAYFLYMAVNLTKDYISMCGMKEIVAVLLFLSTKSSHLSLSLSLSGNIYFQPQFLRTWYKNT